MVPVAYKGREFSNAQSNVNDIYLHVTMYLQNYLTLKCSIQRGQRIQCVFLRLARGFYMLIFQPPVNFYFCENYKT
jgi:hypothetical protein